MPRCALCITIILLVSSLFAAEAKGKDSHEERPHMRTRLKGTFKMRLRQAGGSSSSSSGRLYAEPAPDAPAHTVHVVTSVSPKPCETLTGNYLITLSLKNKHDYAAYKPGFTFNWYMGLADKNLQGMWTKIGVLQNMLSKMPPNDNEWLLWTDADTLFVNTTMDIPFDEYEGKDLVLWDGGYQCLDKKSALIFNAGILLFRNTNWTRNFLERLTMYNEPEWREGGERYKEMFELEDYTSSLYEQAAMIHLWTRNPELKDRILCPAQEWAAQRLEPYPKGYGGLHAQYIDFKESVGMTSGHQPLLAHWPGCQLCSPRFANFDAVNCTRSFLDLYSMASAELSTALGNGLPLMDWGVDPQRIADLTMVGYQTRGYGGGDARRRLLTSMREHLEAHRMWA